MVIAVLAAVVVAIAVAAPQPVADLQYLQHSGWVVRTPAHVLVFDYVDSLPSGTQLPSELRLTAESFDERGGIVFVSHGHADHLSPAISEWARKLPHLQYIVGSPIAALPAAKLLQPHEAWSSTGVVVRATGSTDEGVGFLVAVDGVTMYYAGDHARWAEADDQEFMAEIRWLKTLEQRIDIAFFPIATGAACEPRPSIWEGVRAAVVELAPSVLVPMHVGCPGRLGLYERFRDDIGGQLKATETVAPARLGQSFRYQAGRMTAPD